MDKQNMSQPNNAALIVAWVAGRADETSRIAASSGARKIRVSFTPRLTEGGAVYILVQADCKTDEDRAEAARLLDIVHEWLALENLIEGKHYLMRRSIAEAS